MTTDASITSGKGTRLPLITILPKSNQFSIHVQNGPYTRGYNVPFELNQWYKLEVNHYKMGPRRSMIIWHVDGIEKQRIIQRLFRNLQMLNVLLQVLFKDRCKVWYEI